MFKTQLTMIDKMIHMILGTFAISHLSQLVLDSLNLIVKVLKSCSIRIH